jgi:hypothetical protein
LDNQTLAEQIWATVKRDLTDRRGLRQEWDEFDDDIKDEIDSTNITNIKKVLDKGAFFLYTS